MGIPTNIQTLSCALLLWTAAVQAQPDRVVAKAGDRYISEQEFRQRLELLPAFAAFGRGSTPEAKRELALSLVAEKLLADEARRAGLEQDPQYRAEVANVRRLLARDELYREQVSRAVTVTPDDVRKGVRNARRTLVVAYMHARDSISLATARGPQEAQVLLLDTVEVRWGEAESAVESVVFALPDSIWSAPVETSEGWVRMQIIGRRRNEEAASLDPLTLQSRVEERVRSRKEEARLAEFLRDALRDEDGRALPEAFRRLTTAIRQIADVRPSTEDRRFDGGAWDSVKTMLGPSTYDTLLVMGSRILTIGAAVERLAAQANRLDGFAYPALERRLNEAFREWTLQSILEDIALAAGLDGREHVRDQVAVWSDHYLAEAARRNMGTAITLSDPELYALAAEGSPGIPEPRVDGQAAWAEREEPLLQLASGRRSIAESGDDAVVARTLQSERVMELGPAGIRAWLGPDSVWSHPARSDSGYLSVRITRREIPPSLARQTKDSLYTVGTERTMRRREALLTARLAREHGFALYEESIDAVRVGRAPMLAFRLLGFGGRMFAVPFVRPRLEWADPDLLEGQLLP